MKFSPPGWTRFLLWPGAILFIIPGAIETYFLMPFPGSQEPDVISQAWHLHQFVVPLRFLGALMMIVPLIANVINGTWLRKLGMLILLLVCGAAYFATGIKMTAEAMFREPKSVVFARGDANKVGPEAIVIGIAMNGEAKAFPIRYLAYHHKVHASMGSTPILATYCSMCRTGRVFNPVIDGREQQFRLVGARLYNAIMEDNETKTWWYQANGDAVVGPRAGTHLEEFPSEEMTLGAWTALHPETEVFQPDPASEEGYHMFGFARWDSVRLPKSYYDSTQYTWDGRSWVIGVVSGNHEKAYPWKAVMQLHVINDTIDATPIVIMAERDSLSFHVWNRSVDGIATTFISDSTGNLMHDAGGSTWNSRGECVAGANAGKHLTHVKAYREFWHSWRTFHGASTRFTL